MKNHVHVKDIASHLKVKMPSVNSALKILRENELVVHESYGHVELTKKGHEYAQEIYRRHKLISGFFQEVLGVSYEIADDDACRVEHVLSGETIESLAGFMQAIEENPENLPKWLSEFSVSTKTKRAVTSSEGFIKKGLINLTKAPEGSTFIIHGIDGGSDVSKRLAMLGILPDSVFNVISTQQGQVILEVKGVKIALCGNMAYKLWGKIK